MVGVWLGTDYPLSLAFTYLGSSFMVALPVAIAGMELVLTSVEKKAMSGAKV